MDGRGSLMRPSIADASLDSYEGSLDASYGVFSIAVTFGFVSGSSQNTNDSLLVRAHG